MSTPEQPDHQPLTRKQMRDLRNTGATPVVTPETAAEAPPPAPTPAPLPRAAEPVIVSAPPVADSAVDLGVSPLTRRQARQQERIRTASVPVITPEVAAAHAAAINAPAPAAAGAAEAPQTATAALRDLFGPPAAAVAAPAPPPVSAPVDTVPEVETAESAQVDEAQVEEAPLDEVPTAEASATDTSMLREMFAPAPADDAKAEASAAQAVPASDPWVWAPPPVDGPEEVTTFAIDRDGVAVESAPTADSVDAEERAGDADAGQDDSGGDRGVLNPMFGAGLMAGSASGAVDDAGPSFDQLLSRSATGAIGTPNALILDTAADAPIVGPVTATGEVLITGTFTLPEGLGSTGVAAGSADGKEVDATLVDGELPAHSSPTPIAASSAISTVKSAGEVIRPPAPDKGSRLMLTLAITAGVLALALVGVLILAFVTGVF